MGCGWENMCRNLLVLVCPCVHTTETERFVVDLQYQPAMSPKLLDHSLKDIHTYELITVLCDACIIT